VLARDRHTAVSRRRALALLAIAAVLMAGALGGGYALGSGGGDEATPDTPGDDSVPAGFVRDMRVHHAQAVEMAGVIRDRTDDPALHLLAVDIELTQQSQIGRFDGWLEQWGLSPTVTAPMAWSHGEGVEMGEMEMAMPGMATRAQVDELSSLPVAEAEVLFLQLMIAHHRGGIAMSQIVLGLTDRPEVRRIADAVIVSQQSDIDVMTGMLTKRGA
jgi:uncharacterized protein (DUF305 family)